MAKILELEAKPALKFFYVLSTSNVTNAPPIGGQEAAYNLTTVRSQFSSNMKGSSGNGVLWSLESSSSAPGFYLYTKENNTTNNFSRTKNGVVNPHTENVGIVVGTFALSNDIDNEFSYGTSPEMDILLPLGGYLGNGNYEYSFNFEKEEVVDEGFVLKLTTGDPEILYLKSYKKNFFPNEEGVDELKEEDGYFYSALVEAAKSGSLYLHIWVSLYGGAGQFTNIYWSPLQHIGNIKLF